MASGAATYRWRTRIAAAAVLVALTFGVSVTPASAAPAVAQDPITVADPAVTSAGGPSPTSQDASDATPSHYYIWDGVTPAYTGPRDRWGVVLTQLGGPSGPIVYNPVAVAEWGLHAYENHLHTGSSRPLKDFYAQARSLRRAMDSRGRLPYRYEHPVRPISPPWYSAMAQGLAISVFTRAYIESGDRDWLAAATRASGPFGRDVRYGGVVRSGGAWLEEYPDSHHVLNGSIFAAWGLYDLMRVTGHTGASTEPTATLPQRVWTTFTANLAAHLGDYESRGAILYELGTAHFSGIPYYDLHLRQLRTMAQLTGNTKFEETRVRWATRFKAYPAPVIELRHRRGKASGYRVIYGKVRFLYRNFYGKHPVVSIRRVLSNGSSVRVATLPLRYSAGGDRASFVWTAPVTRWSATYRVTVPTQPHTASSRFDYPQRSSALVTVPGVLSR